MTKIIEIRTSSDRQIYHWNIDPKPTENCWWKNPSLLRKFPTRPSDCMEEVAIFWPATCSCDPIVVCSSVCRRRLL